MTNSLTSENDMLWLDEGEEDGIFFKISYQQTKANGILLRLAVQAVTLVNSHKMLEDELFSRTTAYDLLHTIHSKHQQTTNYFVEIWQKVFLFYEKLSWKHS